MKRPCHNAMQTKRCCELTWFGRRLHQWNSWSWRKKAVVLMSLVALLDATVSYTLAAFGIMHFGPYIIPHLSQIFMALLGLS